MGYSSYISSEQKLTFSRPLNARETRDARTAIEGTSYLSWFFQLDITEDTVETDEGTLTRTTAIGLITTGVEDKAYGLLDELRSFFLNALPDDVTVTGYIERIGEEWPDAERLYATPDRHIVSVRPEIAWRSPEGNYESVKAYEA